MPQISPAEFYSLPLRVHTFLADIPLHDVWAVDLPAHSDGVTLCDFLRRARENKSDRAGSEISRFPFAARALFGLRFFLGRILGLETEPKDAPVASFGNRLTVEDRARSIVEPGTRRRDCSALSIASKTNSWLKYRIAPSMLLRSARLLKKPMVIDSTLRFMCDRRRGLHRCTWA